MAASGDSQMKCFHVRDFKPNNMVPVFGIAIICEEQSKGKRA